MAIGSPTDGEWVCNLCGEAMTRCALCYGEPTQEVIRASEKHWWIHQRQQEKEQ